VVFVLSLLFDVHNLLRNVYQVRFLHWFTCINWISLGI